LNTVEDINSWKNDPKVIINISIKAYVEKYLKNKAYEEL